jgi:hypothetical protein
MITPKIISSTKDGDRIKVVVAFEDSVTPSLSFSQEYSFGSAPSLESLKSQIKSKLDAVEAARAFADGLAIGPIDTTPAIPTQAEADKAQFISLYQRWLSVRRAIDAGIITGNETPVANLKASVLTAFKPSYIDIL